MNHIRSRQEKYGPDEGFRFHSFVNGKDIVAAQYGGNVNTEKAAARNRKQQLCRKKNRENIAKGKKKGKKTTCPGPAAEVDVTVDTAATTNPTAATNCRTHFEPQIDPALLGNDEIIIAKNPVPVTNDTQHPQDSGGYTDDIGMQLLIANGFPNTIPVNGPQDGPPQYFVTTAAMQFLSNHTENNSTINNNSTDINDSTLNKKTENSRKHKSIEKATVQMPRRSGRFRENGKGQQRQTRSQNRVGVVKKS